VLLEFSEYSVFADDAWIIVMSVAVGLLRGWSYE
jgi:hypothetical protein